MYIQGPGRCMRSRAGVGSNRLAVDAEQPFLTDLQLTQMHAMSMKNTYAHDIEWIGMVDTRTHKHACIAHFVANSPVASVSGT